MRSNRVQVSTTKTEILWSTTGRRLHQLPQSPLRVGSNYVAPSSMVRDLGIYLNSDVSMRSHVVKTFCLLRGVKSASECPSVTFQIRSPLADVVTIPVTSGLWQCNLGWHSEVSSPADAVSIKLSCVTRVFFVVVRPLHFTPPPTTLAESTRENLVQGCCSRVQVFALEHGTALSYLADELEYTADFVARTRLQSASSLSLNVRLTRLSTIGDQAFPVAAACTWNSLKKYVTSAPSMSVFRGRLKAFLFRRSFP